MTVFAAKRLGVRARPGREPVLTIDGRDAADHEIVQIEAGRLAAWLRLMSLASEVDGASPIRRTTIHGPDGEYVIEREIVQPGSPR
jgi:hypothetical protein